MNPSMKIFCVPTVGPLSKFQPGAPHNLNRPWSTVPDVCISYDIGFFLLLLLLHISYNLN